MLNKLFDLFGRRKSVDQDFVEAMRNAAKALNAAADRLSEPARVGKPIDRLAAFVAPPRRTPQVPPRRMPVPAPECQADERCGFPLHLPEGSGPTYPPHLAVKVSGDRTECLDCGELWDTNDPLPPQTCKVRDPMKYMHEVGFTDFPFRKPEVTSDYLALIRAARQFMAAVIRRNEGARYVDFWTTADAEIMVASFREWLRDTAFIPNDKGPGQELARLMAAHMTFLRDDPDGRHLTAMCRAVIAWCDRNPLD